MNPPSIEALRDIAANYRLGLTDEQLLEYRDLMGDMFTAYARLDELVEDRAPVLYPRTVGYRPARSDNPLNAWYWRCSIKGAPSGPLAGRRVAVKDTICVAGVPLMNGSRALEGYVPDIDATVITRILDAGGEIVGKAVSEQLSFSGGSHTADTGPVHNPYDRTRSAGGSSSGSAALVSSRACDLALGGDQGGSVRMPASWCGAVGLKPTYGLVPYTGICSAEVTLDHLGPMASNVTDVALLLAAIAGPDGLDSRQAGVTRDDYLGTLESGIEGIRVGVLREGFEWPEVEDDVSDSVRSAAKSLKDLGATVEDISIPWHTDGVNVFTGITVEGSLAQMIRGNGDGTNVKGLHNTSLIDAFHRGRLRDASDFAPTVKLVTLAGEYMQTRYGGRYYAKARNLAYPLARAYDDAFSNYDVLVLPTTPMKAAPLPLASAPPAEILDRAMEMIANTCPFNVTGHPAITLPCALSAGLPVGFMAVARVSADALLLRFARACEGVFRVEPPSDLASNAGLA